MDLLHTARQRLSQLRDAGPGPLFLGAHTGLEKESLRVTATGHIAATPHPERLGSALTHPMITTDYSEALLEFITPPFTDMRESLAFLDSVHAFVFSQLENETLWAASMPCMVDGDESVPIADYGTSNVGRMKRIYRLGLGHRYGRVMQTIAGIHFNYSLPDDFWPRWRGLGEAGTSDGEAASAAYLGALRNFQRFGWLVPFLFGASPAVCKSFLGGQAAAFEPLGKGTWYMPHATSLRMSDIGYKNENQAGLRISYDDLESYVRTLTRAIETPYPPYEAIGVKVDGAYRQLNANILQIENEFYSFIRPKQVARSGEKPTLALLRRGIRYLEVRALDLNPFAPLGVDEPTLRFLEAFLVLCLLTDSPPLGDGELEEIYENQITVARDGRAPGLALRHDGGTRDLRGWAAALCDALEPICAALDAEHEISAYGDSLAARRREVEEPERLPSARLIAEMRERDEAFFTLAMRESRAHQAMFESRPLDPAIRHRFEAEARRSIEQQRQIEQADRLTFDDFLQRYLTQARTERERLLA